MSLSEEDRKALQEEKIGSILAPLDKAALDARRELARRLFDAQPHAPRAPSELYAAFPPWKLYTFGRGKYVLRVLGVDPDTNTLNVAYISYMGVKRSSMTPSRDISTVDDWTPIQKQSIEMCSEPGVFFDPCAWFTG